MKGDRNMLLKSAMVYGLIMGLFWAFKYVFFVLSVSYSFFSFVYWGLTFFVPFLLAVLILHSRVYLPNRISFSQDWSLGVLIYVFAALFVSLEHYIFYRYLAPPNFIADSLSSAIALINNSGVSQEMKETVEAMATPTPIQMTIQGIFNNILYGIVVSFPVAFITNRINVKIKK